MRSLILTLTLLTLSVAVMLCGSFHLVHCCDQLLTRLDALPQKSDPASEVEWMKNYWEKKQGLLSIFTPRSNVQRVSEQLLTLSCHTHLPPDENTRNLTVVLLDNTLRELKQDALPFAK